MSGTAASSARPKRFKNHVMPGSEEEILESLKCGTCNLIALEPIKLCVSGHTICGDCCRKSGVFCAYANCGAKISTIQNRGLESLLGIVNLMCRNRPCRQNVVGTSLREHMTQECYYRPVKCPELHAGRAICVPYNLYLNHLKTNHRAQVVDFDEDNHSVKFENYAHNFDADSLLRKTIMNHGDTAFILNYSSTPTGDRRNHIIRVWVSTMLEEPEASKYRISIRIKQTHLKVYAVDSEASVKWDLGIHSVHLPLTEYEKLNDLGVILSESLSNFSSRSVTIDGESWNYVWDLKCIVSGFPLSEGGGSPATHIYLSGDSSNGSGDEADINRDTDDDNSGVDLSPHPAFSSDSSSSDEELS